MEQNETKAAKIQDAMNYLEGINSELMEALNCGELHEKLNDDALDYDFRVGSSKFVESGRVWLTIGGPTVWIDTEDGTINYKEFWQEAVKYFVPEVLRNAVYDWVCEIYC